MARVNTWWMDGEGRRETYEQEELNDMSPSVVSRGGRTVECEGVESEGEEEIMRRYLAREIILRIRRRCRDVWRRG